MEHRRPKLAIAKVLALEYEIIELLHAARDCMRNNGRDWKKIGFDGNTWNVEAGGVARAVVAIGYGVWGATNGEPVVARNGLINVKAWLSQLEYFVLHEEHVEGDYHCALCLFKYRKDGIRILESKEEALTSSCPYHREFGLRGNWEECLRKIRKDYMRKRELYYLGIK